MNVKAIESGIVRVVAYDEKGFGNYISIEQGDGYRALYCHLQKSLVKVGDNIKVGQKIGIEGKTGNTTGVHLHLEMRKSPFNSANHIDVTKYLGIQNKEGLVEEIIRITKEEAIKKLRTILEEQTIQYLDFYRYGDELIIKLAENM